MASEGRGTAVAGSRVKTGTAGGNSAIAGQQISFINAKKTVTSGFYKGGRDTAGDSAARNGGSANPNVTHYGGGSGNK